MHSNTGTGKSTIADLITMLLPDDEVCNLQNKSEEQFGLSAAVTDNGSMCHLITLREMKSDCNWDTSLMQSIASGEGITVSQKYGKPLQFRETNSHLLMIGNVIPKKWAGACVPSCLSPLSIAHHTHASQQVALRQSLAVSRPSAWKRGYRTAKPTWR